MQSIYTRYLGATTYRGARVKATATGGESLTVSWNYDTEMNHMLAAMALAKKLDWKGTWVEGAGPNKTGNVYVCLTGEGFKI